mgnify:CR=1 FL=1
MDFVQDIAFNALTLEKNTKKLRRSNYEGPRDVMEDSEVRAAAAADGDHDPWAGHEKPKNIAKHETPFRSNAVYCVPCKTLLLFNNARNHVKKVHRNICRSSQEIDVMTEGLKKNARFVELKEPLKKGGSMGEKGG